MVDGRGSLNEDGLAAGTKLVSEVRTTSGRPATRASSDGLPGVPVEHDIQSHVDIIGGSANHACRGTTEVEKAEDGDDHPFWVHLYQSGY